MVTYRLRRRARQEGKQHMRKWMALLLCCLLCVCAAGAMAEGAVTLSLDNYNKIGIYPNGYQEKGKAFVPYTGPYIITGTSTGVDTCLDFYSIPYGKSQATEPVTYTVTFKGVTITAGTYCTALRFGSGEWNGANITLNLINTGTSSVQLKYNHAMFSNQFNENNRKSVTVNIDNTLNSSLTLRGGPKDPDGDWGMAGTNVTVHIGDKTITTRENVSTVTIEHILKREPAKAPTCTEEGHIEHYRCAVEGCGKLFDDVDGTKELTAVDVSVPALGHDLQKVPAKAATYEQEGNIEYYRCTRCGKLLSDANGTKELTAGEVILEKLVRTDGLPQTGDSSHLLRWAALLGACCAGLWCLNRRRG